MKLLQIVQKPQRRGAEVFAYYLSNRLRKEGYQVNTVYLYPYVGPGTLPLEEGDVVLMAREKHPMEIFPGIHFGTLKKMLHLIRSFQPDVVQVNGGRTVKYGAIARTLDRHGKWVLVYRNIGDPRMWIRTKLHRFFYKKYVIPKIDGIVAVSKMTMQTLQSFYNLQVPTVNILRGVEPTALVSRITRKELRSQMGIPDDLPVIVFVGSLTQEKRLDRLFRIIQKTSEQVSPLRLWLIGDGPLRNRLEQLSNELKIQELVQFLGTKDQIASFLAAADVFVLTSDTEGIPGVVLEAGFMGLPVVATRVGGVPECIVEGRSGYMVDPDNEEEFVSKLVHLLRSPKQRMEIGIYAQEWVRNNFTLDAIVPKYIEFYEYVRNSVSR